MIVLTTQLNHLASLVKLLSVCLLRGCGFESRCSHVTVISVRFLGIHFPVEGGASPSKTRYNYARNLKFGT